MTAPPARGDRQGPLCPGCRATPCHACACTASIPAPWSGHALPAPSPSPWGHAPPPPFLSPWCHAPPPPLLSPWHHASSPCVLSPRINAPPPSFLSPWCHAPAPCSGSPWHRSPPPPPRASARDALRPSPPPSRLVDSQVPPSCECITSAPFRSPASPPHRSKSPVRKSGVQTGGGSRGGSVLRGRLEGSTTGSPTLVGAVHPADTNAARSCERCISRSISSRLERCVEAPEAGGDPGGEERGECPSRPPPEGRPSERDEAGTGARSPSGRPCSSFALEPTPGHVPRPGVASSTSSFSTAPPDAPPAAASPPNALDQRSEGGTARPPPSGPAPASTAGAPAPTPAAPPVPTLESSPGLVGRHREITTPRSRRPSLMPDADRCCSCAARSWPRRPPPRPRALEATGLPPPCAPLRGPGPRPSAPRGPPPARLARSASTPRPTRSSSSSSPQTSPAPRPPPDAEASSADISAMNASSAAGGATACARGWGESAASRGKGKVSVGTPRGEERGGGAPRPGVQAHRRIVALEGDDAPRAHARPRDGLPLARLSSPVRFRGPRRRTSAREVARASLSSASAAARDERSGSPISPSKYRRVAHALWARTTQWTRSPGVRRRGWGTRPVQAQIARAPWGARAVAGERPGPPSARRAPRGGADFRKPARAHHRAVHASPHAAISSRSLLSCCPRSPRRASAPRRPLRPSARRRPGRRPRARLAPRPASRRSPAPLARSRRRASARAPWLRARPRRPSRVRSAGSRAEMRAEEGGGGVRGSGCEGGATWRRSRGGPPRRWRHAERGHASRREREAHWRLGGNGRTSSRAPGIAAGEARRLDRRCDPHRPLRPSATSPRPPSTVASVRRPSPPLPTRPPPSPLPLSSPPLLPLSSGARRVAAAFGERRVL